MLKHIKHLFSYILPLIIICGICFQSCKETSKKSTINKITELSIKNIHADLDNKRYKTAIKKIDEMLNIDSANSELYYLKGFSFLCTGRQR